MNEFLTARHFMYERVTKGIDAHLSDADAKEFQKQAKAIDPKRHFTIYGCQSCINDLVKFVYDNQKTFIKKETFPKANASKEDTGEGAE